jgi:hypothetical protein
VGAEISEEHAAFVIRVNKSNLSFIRMAVPLKHEYTFSRLCGVTLQKMVIFTVIAVRTSDITQVTLPTAVGCVCLQYAESESETVTVE